MRSPSPRRYSSIVLFLLIPALVAVQGSAARAEGPALLRIDLDGPPEELGIPVYAHLRSAEGEEYVLTRATPAEAEAAGLSYTVLDADAADAEYLIALERRPGARARAGRELGTLLDDGRRLVVRAEAVDGEELHHLGFVVSRLPKHPLVLQAAPVALARAATFHPDVAAMVAEVRKAFVYHFNGQLSGEKVARVGGTEVLIDTRNTNSGAPIDLATQFVYEHLLTQGLDVTYFPWNRLALSGRNVVGELTGAVHPAEVVLITAHLDSLPSTGPGPGADDNGSGSTAVMLASKILAKREFARTVRFIFFTGEEQGLWGSQFYAEAMAEAGEVIVAVLNLDMIAWDSLEGPVLRLHTRPESNPGHPGDRAIAELFTDVVATYGLDDTLDTVLDPDGITASDHSPFWNWGFPAILAIEDDKADFNPNWHLPSDRRETLNIPYFTDFVKAAVGTVAHLAIPSDSAVDVALVRPNQMQGAVLSPSSVELTWNDRSDNESSFEVVSRIARSRWQKAGVVAADAERFVATGLAGGSTYEFRVRARAGNAASGWSNRAILTPPAVTLTRPNQLRALVVSATEVQLEWNDRSDGEGFFEVHLRTPTQAWARALTIGADVSQAALSGLTPGGTYLFRVRARRGRASSPWSNRATVTLPGG